MVSKKPHVLIIGAGLGGLLLAQALRKRQINFEIFERDAHANARQQGWALGLHSILNDIQAHVPDELPPIEPSVNHLEPLKLPAQFACYVNGLRLAVTGSPDTFVLRANRNRLRHWLATNIPISYNKQATSIEEAEYGVTVHFQDGTQVSGDILVGADGINSYVREYLLSRPNKETLQTNPFAVIVGETTLAGAEFERQLSLSHSSYLGISASKTLSIFVGLDKVSDDGRTGYYYWYLMVPDEHTDNLDHWTKHATRAERLEKALEYGKQLDDTFTEIIKLTPEEGMRTDAFSFRDAEILEHEVRGGRVTMLGDAAHPMAPFRGEGGVHAMRDALELAEAIDRCGNDGGETILENIAAYQEHMMRRGVEAVQKSRGQVRDDRRQDEPWMIWGYPTKPTPEEAVKLSDWL
ncbi:hypothetical protein PFICI_12214 [Pestalotiopsis fici W106-1]|uniref:FAD-binding domain-containing protein n=1 Tax=Pestalotiopsis fici (strain W106-1 / CGMCC3.15140) TaxID=1229662 RepID=W3WMZ5_PESFW|nr:uncharacterized protein PFICI_12214 [Pestalotiopsis fici W106-1]ETS75270.1 hypothetical protein PFICI_12214 [Pestalotiopsis fici W106-1]